MNERISVTTARLVTVVALIVGVPQFLRMPPWCDLTLYDVAAANLLAGGVHYRDVFDTNLPGFVWLLTAIRFLFGESVEVVRLIDLGIVVGIVQAADRLAAAGGADRSARVWAVAAAAWFYPFISEFNHAQRDVWMLWPALAATSLRIRTLGAGKGPSFRSAWLQGTLWGVAVWIKPHVVVPALLVWLASLHALRRRVGTRGCLRDFAGLLLGGAGLGILGVSLLAASGSWPAFVEVFTFWNAGYVAVMWQELPERIVNHFKYFAPWTYFQVVAWPVALLSIVEGFGLRVPASKLWVKPENDDARTARLLFAVLYLGWSLQALLTQRGFHYVHVPEILLLFFVVATQRRPLGVAAILWCIATSIIVGMGWHADEALPQGRVFESDSNVWCVRHPIADPKRLREWTGCFHLELSERESMKRRQRLALVRDFFPANDWDQLCELAEELRRRGVRDGELLAWHDAPHAVYRLVPTRPGFRFMHVRAMMAVGPEQEACIHAELVAALPHVRYVVSDLMRVGYEDPDEIGDRTAAGPDLLPPSLRADLRMQFPYAMPAVFRTNDGRGRYVLHDLAPR